MTVVGVTDNGVVTLDGKAVLRFSSSRLEVTLDEGDGRESTHPIAPALIVVLASMTRHNLDTDMRAFGSAAPLTTRQVFHG